MTKVYPNGRAGGGRAAAACSSDERQILMKSDAVVELTVWKKSLLFNCEGFTVFDAKGNLIYRVDNYLTGSRAEIILMDASGTSLLTIRRKRLSLGDNWLVYNKGDTAAKPVFSARKHVNLLNSKFLAHVSSSGCGSPKEKKNVMIYEIEGSYTQRCCAVYDGKRRRVAEIRRKETAIGGASFGLDVFRLVVVQPEMDSAVAMALVILLDKMFGPSRRFSL